MPREIGLGKKLTKDALMGKATSLEEKGVLFTLINCFKKANKDKRLTYILLRECIRLGQHKEVFVSLYNRGFIDINYNKELLKHVQNFSEEVYRAYGLVNELSEYKLPDGVGTLKYINNVLKRGNTVDEIVKVYANNIEKWWGSEWAVYLRPKTTLGKKFDTYLQEFNDHGMGKQLYSTSKVKSGAVIDQAIIDSLEDGVKYNVLVESQEGKRKAELIKSQIQSMMNLNIKPKMTLL